MKKLWLLPLGMIVLLVFTRSSALAPFIYRIF
jgi:hypothetical protein